MFLIAPTPDVSVYISGQRQMLGCSLLLNGGQVEIGRGEIFASLVCTVNGVSVENIQKTPIA